MLLSLDKPHILSLKRNFLRALGSSEQITGGDCLCRIHPSWLWLVGNPLADVGRAGSRRAYVRTRDLMASYLDIIMEIKSAV